MPRLPINRNPGTHHPSGRSFREARASAPSSQPCRRRCAPRSKSACAPYLRVGADGSVTSSHAPWLAVTPSANIRYSSRFMRSASSPPEAARSSFAQRLRSGAIRSSRSACNRSNSATRSCVASVDSTAAVPSCFVAHKQSSRSACANPPAYRARVRLGTARERTFPGERRSSRSPRTPRCGRS